MCSNLARNGARCVLDLDGVVVNFTAEYERCFLAEFGQPMGPKVGWDGFAAASGGVFGDEGEFWAWLATTDCWRDPEIFPGADEAVGWLTSQFDVQVVTSKPAWAVGRTLEWLGRTVGAAGDIRAVRFTRTLEAKAQIDAELYLEDSPRALNAFLARGRDAEAMILGVRRSWNEELQDNPRIWWLDDLTVPELERVLCSSGEVQP